MAVKNANLFQFRITDSDTEIRDVFNEINEKLYTGKKVEHKDIILELVRGYRRNDSVVIPSQKSLLEEIRKLLLQHTLLRREATTVADEDETDDLDLDLINSLGGLLDQFGVETDDY